MEVRVHNEASKYFDEAKLKEIETLVANEPLPEAEYTNKKGEKVFVLHTAYPDGAITKQTRFGQSDDGKPRKYYTENASLPMTASPTVFYKKGGKVLSMTGAEWIKWSDGSKAEVVEAPKPEITPAGAAWLAKQKLNDTIETNEKIKKADEKK